MAEIADEELKDLQDKAASADALQAQLEEKQTAITEAETTVAQTRDAVALATQTVRTALITANPAIPEDLIKGDTIEALNESVTSATAIANRLAEAAAAQGKGALGFLQGGGTTRQPANTEGMTSLQKVVHGIQYESEKHLA